eukprot:6180316-Pyramimonas_sp.AAC.2
MHTKHLGVDKYFLGSVLWVLVFMLIPNTPDAALQIVFESCEKWWRDHGVSSSDCFSKLKVSMFIDPKKPRAKYPELKGKAGEIKNLIAPLTDVFKFWMEEGDQVHEQIHLALRMNCRIEEILKDNPCANILPGDQKDEFSQCIWVFLACQTAAARFFLHDAQLLFDITIKPHHLAHWALESQFVNCRR